MGERARNWGPACAGLGCPPLVSNCRGRPHFCRGRGFVFPLRLRSIESECGPSKMSVWTVLGHALDVAPPPSPRVCLEAPVEAPSLGLRHLCTLSAGLVVWTGLYAGRGGCGPGRVEGVQGTRRPVHPYPGVCVEPSWQADPLNLKTLAVQSGAVFWLVWWVSSCFGRVPAVWVGFCLFGAMFGPFQ